MEEGEKEEKERRIRKNRKRESSRKKCKSRRRKCVEEKEGKKRMKEKIGNIGRKRNRRGGEGVVFFSFLFMSSTHNFLCIICLLAG